MRVCVWLRGGGLQLLANSANNPPKNDFLEWSPRLKDDMSFTSLRICLGSPLPGNVRSLADSSPRKLCSKRGERTFTLFYKSLHKTERHSISLVKILRGTP